VLSTKVWNNVKEAWVGALRVVLHDANVNVLQWRHGEISQTDRATAKKKAAH